MSLQPVHTRSNLRAEMKRVASRKRSENAVEKRRRRRSEGKRMKVTVCYTDAGKPGRSSSANNWFASKALLNDNNKVYSTDPRNKKKKNFNIAFAAEGKREFSRACVPLRPTKYRIARPGHFDNPLSKGLMFILDDLSQLIDTERFDDCDHKTYLKYAETRKASEAYCPMMYCDMKEQLAFYENAALKHTTLNSIGNGLAKIVASYVADPLPLSEPVGYFSFSDERGEQNDRKEKNKKDFEVDFPRSGRYIVLKLVGAAHRGGAVPLAGPAAWAAGPRPAQPIKTIDVRFIAFYA